MPKALRFIFPRLGLILTLLFLTVGCDQASKFLVRDTLPITGTLTYLGNNVRFQLAQNRGAFLSLGAHLDEDARFWIFNISVSLVLCVLAWVLFVGRELNSRMTLGLTLILAGGIGNLIDRFAFGSVTDFLNLGIGNLRTGIFNFADVAIVIGVLLILASHRPVRTLPAR
jgi:signal peptidase II